jgi:KDO2-lipid IV(A) lauroyltransferase
MADAERAVQVTFAQRLEYFGLRLLSTVMRPFGWRNASRFGAFVGGLGHWPFAIRADRVERAIRACFPEFDEARVKRTARESYRGLGRVTIEAIALSRVSREELMDAFVEPAGFDALERAYKQGRGVVLVSGHLGNWELSAAYMVARGITVDAIAMHMANPLSDDFFRRTRERMGVNVVFDDEAVRRIPRAFKDGHAVGFLSDQGAKGLASTFVPFFGRPAKTPRGAAVFALRSDLPVIFLVAIRQPDLRYRLHFEEVPVTRTGDRDADVDALVLSYTQVLERYVSEYPGQYFWQHRRWRRQPPDTPEHLREP